MHTADAFRFSFDVDYYVGIGRVVSSLEGLKPR
jgi:hypothetical protein